MEKAHGRTNHAFETLSMINQFHKDEKYWDVQLLVDGKLFKCQRSLLAASSEYFDTMFSSSDFKESNAAKDQPVTMDKIDTEAFEEILNFMYTGDVRVYDGNVLHLLILNDFLRLRTACVKEKCLEYVKDCAEGPWIMSNALNLLHFARSMEENAIVDALNAHICRHLYEFSKKAQLMEISFESLRGLLKCAKNCILPLPGSSDILLAIIYNWVNCNREERSEYRCELIGSFDSSKVSSDFKLSLIKRLENAADEVDLPRDSQSISELKTLEMGIDTCDIGGNARCSATISLNVKNMSKLECGQELFSSSCIISNLSWKTIVRRQNLDDVCFGLKCDGTDSTREWNCYAIAHFTVKSHEEHEEDFESVIGHVLFSSLKKGSDRCYGDGLKFNDLIKKKKGHNNIKDDDSITIYARVNADVPFRHLALPMSMFI